jgi:hypothetical protein
VSLEVMVTAPHQPQLSPQHQQPQRFVQPGAADCIEVCPTADVEEHSVEKTLRMLRLSEKMKVDSSLARQLRRKFVE